MNPPPISARLPSIVDLARRAGKKILEVKREALAQIETKSDQSPVTLADRAADALIVQGLTRLTPDIPVLSEEGELALVQARIAANPGRHYWLVDPLDGTKEFIKDNGEYTVNIALVEGERPVLGVICAPELDTTWWAATGLGAYKQQADRPAFAIRANDRKRTLCVVASRSHFSAATKTLVDRLAEHFGQVELVQRGSSVKICALAEGSADLYPRLAPTMLWDTAAGYAIAAEAGCRLVDLEGRDLTYSPAGDLRQQHFVAYTTRLAGVAEAVLAALGRGAQP